jgi:hypothetical protein
MSLTYLQSSPSFFPKECLPPLCQGLSLSLDKLWEFFQVVGMGTVSYPATTSLVGFHVWERKHLHTFLP